MRCPFCGANQQTIYNKKFDSYSFCCDELAKRYPQGKIQDSDEGQQKIMLSVAKNRVLMDFGKELSWIGFDKQQAILIGETLLKLSDQLTYSDN